MHIQAKLGRESLLRMWDEWDDTDLQTQNSKFKPWEYEAEHATSRTRRLPTILSFTSGWGRNMTTETGKQTPNSCVKGSGAPRGPRRPPQFNVKYELLLHKKVIILNTIEIYCVTKGKSMNILYLVYCYIIFTRESLLIVTSHNRKYLYLHTVA